MKRSHSIALAITAIVICAGGAALVGPRLVVWALGGCEVAQLDRWPELRSDLTRLERLRAGRELLRSSCPGGIGAAHRELLADDGRWPVREGAEHSSAVLPNQWSLRRTRREHDLLCPDRAQLTRRTGAQGTLAAYDACELARLGIFDRDQLNPLVLPTTTWSLVLRLHNQGVSREAAVALTRDLSLRRVALQLQRYEGLVEELPTSSATHLYPHRDLVVPKAGAAGITVYLPPPETGEGRGLHVFAPGSRRATAVLDAIRQRIDELESSKISSIGIVTMSQRDTQPLALIRVEWAGLARWIGDATNSSLTWQELVDRLEMSHAASCSDWKPWAALVESGHDDWSTTPLCEFAEL